MAHSATAQIMKPTSPHTHNIPTTNTDSHQKDTADPPLSLTIACSVITIISEGSLEENIPSVFLGEVG